VISAKKKIEIGHLSVVSEQKTEIQTV